ncbi:hypothetical protein bcere0025_59850 [Bacillus cereus F65185]|nr:hypothetical protein bcere0025_59850 [Bacillus cereus F65185]
MLQQAKAAYKTNGHIQQASNPPTDSPIPSLIATMDPIRPNILYHYFLLEYKAQQQPLQVPEMQL